ncbi:hypothetical protein OGAPHI_005232 [Ogataea philodendri]|uniref:Uncharacterized protein n=1 Tax=Ogataea philodendri TaxID=1378263 RepID=A0A9P8T352_9ASCO|nr:uncharacterized protein OGAPHI_005232 [Ogataea philodendri]KAH3663829.1 hypothetical protein OGAPHI_005232 [Ogataea philodendri]
MLAEKFRKATRFFFLLNRKYMLHHNVPGRSFRNACAGSYWKHVHSSRSMWVLMVCHIQSSLEDRPREISSEFIRCTSSADEGISVKLFGCTDEKSWSG